ncbi:MAG: hypothetical protein LBL54_02690 [Clostridiales Family XIII bacterium]|nr:hypothetical protein [Clostridiales Family XIII bacterium]
MAPDDREAWARAGEAQALSGGGRRVMMGKFGRVDKKRGLCPAKGGA